MTTSKRRRPDQKPVLALDNPVDQAWGARLLQLAIARHRRRLADDKHAKTSRTRRAADGRESA